VRTGPSRIRRPLQHGIGSVILLRVGTAPELHEHRPESDDLLVRRGPSLRRRIADGRERTVGARLATLTVAILATRNGAYGTFVSGSPWYLMCSQARRTPTESASSPGLIGSSSSVSELLDPIIGPQDHRNGSGWAAIQGGQRGERRGEVGDHPVGHARGQAPGGRRCCACPTRAGHDGAWADD